MIISKEKCFKALLVALEIDFNFSHDLFYLLNLIDEKIPFEEEWFEKAAILKDFAVKIRYPSGIEIPSDEKIAETIGIVELFRLKIFQIIQTV